MRVPFEGKGQTIQMTDNKLLKIRVCPRKLIIMNQNCVYVLAQFDLFAVAVSE